MIAYNAREHYLPLRRGHLLDILLHDRGVTNDRPMTTPERERFGYVA
jgi:hypothetical protein